MKYFITELSNCDCYDVEISLSEFEEIRNARKVLLLFLNIEELFVVLIENYIEYEMELLEIATRCMVDFSIEDDTATQFRLNVARRLANLLTTCKMYLDQVRKILVDQYGEKSTYCQGYDKERNNQYDTKLGYRVLESIRDYSQHRDLPIHSMLFSAKWLDIDDDLKSRSKYSATPYLDINRLYDDKKFKKGIIQELEQIKQTKGVDMRPLVREYIEGIGVIQERVRLLSENEIFSCELLIANSKKRFLADNSHSTSSYVWAISIGEDNELVEKVNLSEVIISRRKKISMKYQHFVNLKKRFSTNEL